MYKMTVVILLGEERFVRNDNVRGRICHVSAFRFDWVRVFDRDYRRHRADPTDDGSAVDVVSSHRSRRTRRLGRPRS